MVRWEFARYKFAINCKFIRFLGKAPQTPRLDSGNKEEAGVWYRVKIPMYPRLAKAMKEKVGADFLRSQGYNLSEADAEFGHGWLDK
jgi:hypothetical protein